MINFCDTADDRRRTTEHLLRQLFASGTSIGANLAEASAGQTKPDIIATTCVSLKEAREARYWLMLVIATRPPLHCAAVALIDEARQLVSILTAIVKNARSSPNRGQGRALFARCCACSGVLCIVPSSSCVVRRPIVHRAWCILRRGLCIVHCAFQ